MITRFDIFERDLQELDKKNQNIKILDAGAGEQRNRQYITNNSYISQDYAQYEAGGSTEYWDTKRSKKWKAYKCDIISDIIDIPVKDNSFDVVICTEVFEHIPEPLLAIKEINRILKPKGELLLTVPNLCHYHQEPYYFYSGFSEEFFNYAAKEYQMEVINIFKESNFYEFLILELSLIRRYQTNKFKRLLIGLPVKLFVETLKIFKPLFEKKYFVLPKNYTGYYVRLRKK